MPTYLYCVGKSSEVLEALVWLTEYTSSVDECRLQFQNPLNLTTLIVRTNGQTEYTDRVNAKVLTQF